MGDGGEFLALRTSFGKQIAAKPWPLEGDTVVIGDSWDGSALHGSSAFLSLVAGDRVLVTHRNRDGLLYGSVEVDLGQPERAGWFGGKGCVASLEVTLPVPLGPGRSLTEVPWGPPGSDGANGDAGDADPEVEAYILRHGIDTSAAQALRELDYDMQAQVIQSDLTNCRNPSAVLLCRIDRVRTATATPPPPRSAMAVSTLSHQTRSRSPPRRQSQPPVPPAEPASPEAVEEFIIHHGLDEKAAQALRDVPPDLQSTIIEIELSNCRNPSAVVVSRIQSLNATANYVESYIQEFGLDDKCAAELRSISPLEQQQVIEARPTNARNPSAVVISRIQAVRSQGQQLQLVEDYIVRHGIDDSVANSLRNMSHEGQRQIINSDLSNCRNPSAVLLSRIRAVEGQGTGRAALPSPRPPPPPGQPRPPLLPSAATAQYRAPPPSVPASSDESPEAFIQRHNLDQEAAQAMRALPAELQIQVMERGELINCRNPSKVLISRIRQLNA